MAAKRKAPDAAAAPSKKQRDTKVKRDTKPAPLKRPTAANGAAPNKRPLSKADPKRPPVKLTRYAMLLYTPLPAHTLLHNRKERKERKVKLLSAKKKHYTLSQELVGHWETIRQHNVSKEKRAELVTTVLEKSKDRVAELAASHVTSRVLQACAKYGTGSQRAAMLAEVMPQCVPLAKSPYGHFMLRKLVATAPKATVPGALAGALCLPSQHVVGVRVGR